MPLFYTDSCGIHMMKLVLCVGVESGQISLVNGTETNLDFCFKRDVICLFSFGCRSWSWSVKRLKHQFGVASDGHISDNSG